MPRAEGDDGVYRLPGLYASLLEHERANVDPRLYYGIKDPLEQWWARETAPRVHPQLVKRLEAGEPVTIPHWRIGGNTWPQARDWPIYRDRSVRAWEVHADDVVVPVHARDM